MTNNHPYEDRYCAFVDILAFRTLLRTRECGQIQALLSHIYSPFPGTQENQKHSGYRAQSISDAVAVSTDATDASLRHLFIALSWLQVLFFVTGVYLRGAIVRGLLFHDEKMVFGETLVEAYRIECTIACFPRIMIATSVTKDISVSEHAEYFSKKIKESDDGAYLHYLDALDQFTGEPIHPNHVQRRVLDQFIIGAKTLQRNYNASLGNERHFKKLHWLAEYFNSAIHPECKNLPRISGLGLDEKGTPLTASGWILLRSSKGKTSVMTRIHWVTRGAQGWSDAACVFPGGTRFETFPRSRVRVRPRGSRSAAGGLGSKPAVWYDAGMSRDQVKEILDRVLTWPAKREADVAHVVEMMEAQDRSTLHLTDEQLAEMRRRRAEKNPKTITLAELNARLRQRYGV